jgi:hypothetical protein
MRRAIVTGLVALVLATGCGKQESTTPNNVANQPTQAVERAVKKADLTLNLGVMGKHLEPTLLVNDNMAYLFVRSDDAYNLVRINSDQLTDLVVKYDDPNNDKSVTMDLGDGRTYTLAHNAESGEYHLSH